MKLEQIIKSENNMKGTVCITSAQKFARPNYKMLESIGKYNKANEGELIILPMAGKSVDEDELHPDLRSKNIVDSSVYINKNIKISNYQIKPQQILPLTGIRRFASGDKSFIFASPKINLEYVPNSFDKIPKAIMTTGACTEPNYRTSNRIGKIAKADHQYGFVVVNKVSNSIYHSRQVPVLRNGKFVDLGMTYDGNKKPYRAVTEALIVGDLHPYDTDPKHEKCTFQQIKYLKPKRAIFHDTFNGMSITHHEKGQFGTQYKTYMKQGQNLHEELKVTLKAINKYAKAQAEHNGEVYIVASNHDEFLARYINEGRFIGDKGNDYIGSKLYTALLEDKHVLKTGLELVGDLEKNVIFLNRRESLKVKGYQLGDHGDKGSNGGKGSVKSLEEANGKSISAHGHTAYRMRNVIKTGTSTVQRIGYNDGYSNWTQTNVALYDIGTAQHLNTINGKWR